MHPVIYFFNVQSIQKPNFHKFNTYIEQVLPTFASLKILARCNWDLFVSHAACNIFVHTDTMERQKKKNNSLIGTILQAEMKVFC